MAQLTLELRSLILENCARLDRPDSLPDDGPTSELFARDSRDVRALAFYLRHKYGMASAEDQQTGTPDGA